MHACRTHVEEHARQAHWNTTCAGVSESIIMGIPMPTGTGLFKLHQHAEDRALPELQPLPLLAY